ncbi:MAG: hypothetical protein AAB320_09625 [Elusimicrobiota bacterium]
MRTPSRFLTILLSATVLLAPMASATKLDLDIYASPIVLPKPAAEPLTMGFQRRAPGDPRDLKGASRPVKYLTHLGYAGMGVAGLVGSLATGGVAPAIGFGLVALIHLVGTWQLHKTPEARS